MTVFYVLERGSGLDPAAPLEYWGGASTWTTDIRHAARYPSLESAQRRLTLPEVQGARVSEHAWVNEAVQGPERLAAYRKISRALAAFDWIIGPSGRPAGTAFVKQEDYDALLAGIDELRRAGAVSLPDSGDAPRAEPPEEIIEIDERGVVHPKGRKSTVLLDPEPECTGRGERDTQEERPSQSTPPASTSGAAANLPGTGSGSAPPAIAWTNKRVREQLLPVARVHGFSDAEVLPFVAVLRDALHAAYQMGVEGNRPALRHLDGVLHRQLLASAPDRLRASGRAHLYVVKAHQIGRDAGYGVFRDSEQTPVWMSTTMEHAQDIAEAMRVADWAAVRAALGSAPRETPEGAK